MEGSERVSTASPRSRSAAYAETAGRSTVSDKAVPASEKTRVPGRCDVPVAAPVPFSGRPPAP